jgi:ABC-type nitrate/sulfonate/bicarbonate transport system ATPase subunit
MLELAGAAKSLGGRQIVADASFAVRQGEILCLTGPSGIGKSTILELAAGILPPDHGTVCRQAPVALMFQDDALIPWLTAEANIGYILPADVSPSERVRKATIWLRRFGLESGQYPSAMSGGMRRRLSLARTFAAGRPLLILDEPFAFLDEDWQTTVAEEIACHAADGACILLASHTTEPLSPESLIKAACRIVHVEETPVIINI